MSYKFLNAKDFADLLYSNPKKEIDFSFDTEEDIEENHPTGWHGAKLIYLFTCDSPILTMGYYGDYNPSVYNIGEIFYKKTELYLSGIKENIEKTKEIIEASLLDYGNQNCDFFNNENTFCVEIEEESQSTLSTFNVSIRETLVKSVKIEATTIEEAKEKVNQMYKNADIILSAVDFTGDVDIRCYDNAFSPLEEWDKNYIN